MIENKQAVLFSNEHLRRFADLYSGAYQAAKQIQVQWLSDGMAAIIPDDAAEEFDDGAHEDGRSIVDGAEAHALKAAADELIGEFEANNSLTLMVVAKYSVNPRG